MTAAVQAVPFKVLDAPAAASRALADVLNEITEHIATYIECSTHAQAAMALWLAYTHLIPTKGPPPHDVVPYIFITSVERQSGKTTLLDVMRPIAARPVMLAGTSPAALLRMLGNRPTLFLDEVDTIFRASAADSTQEMLRGILNSGYRATGKFARFELKQKEYPTFGPKALAGIGRDIPESVYDRCITIRLERRQTDGKRVVKRARLRRLNSEGAAIASRITEVVAGVVLEPFGDEDFPDALSDRAADIWEPLLALGEAAGSTWGAIARAAAVAISRSSADDSLSEGQQLLRDLRLVFDNAMKAADFISTQEVIGLPEDLRNNQFASGLCAIEDGPWVLYGRTGRPITPHRFWKLIGEYRIPRVSNGQARGMRPTDFAEAFSRYVPKADDAGITGT
jgi:Protein of unknown function (DUF3631)